MTLPAPSRRSCRHRAALVAGIGDWANDIRPVRGRCHGGTKRRPCPSRWAVPRVSLDFRDPGRVDRLATLECAVCGRVWRRIPPCAIRSAEGYQSTLVTIILPASATRWYSRGRWHRDGDDGEVLVNARLEDVDEAVGRNDLLLARKADVKARALARKAESDAAAIARMNATLARLDERDADRAAEERAAAERENAYR